MKLLRLHNHVSLKTHSAYHSLLASSYLPATSLPSSSRVRVEQLSLTAEQLPFTDRNHGHSLCTTLQSRKSPSGCLQILQLPFTSPPPFTSSDCHHVHHVSLEQRPQRPCALPQRPRACQLAGSYFPPLLRTSTIPTARIINTRTLYTSTMAKDIAKGSDSSLSPPPEDLQVSAETEDITKTTAVSMKRKAETTVTKTVTTTKRTKKAQVADTNDNNDDAKDQTAEMPRQKRATAKNVKQKRTKKSKEPVLPLEERTADTKLRIGAHVSIAGG